MAKGTQKALQEVPREAARANLGYLGHGFPALHEVRKNALMLSLGNAFLCEEVFLKKTGTALQGQIENLRKEIQELKQKFPGIFLSDTDTDSILETLLDQAQKLQKPNKGLIDKCTIGVLGRELEETVDALTGAVRSIKRRVEGETPTYTAKDSVLGVIDKAKTPVSMVTKAISVAIKTALVLVLLALGPLVYLAVSMDREAALLKEIAQSEVFIENRREMVASAERERQALWQEIEAARSDDAPREKKLEMMEMNVKLHSLDQSRNRAEAEISAQEEIIRLKKQRLQVVREKPFLDRFLRR